MSEQAELIPFTAVSDYEHWIARLKTIDRYIAQNASVVPSSASARKRTQPPRGGGARAAQLAELIKPGADNPFYAPFERIPEFAFSRLDRAFACRPQRQGRDHTTW